MSDSVGYELWDTESRNLLYDFDTESEALQAARDLLDLNPSRYPGALALVRVDVGGHSTTLASGEALEARVTLGSKGQIPRSA